MGTGHHGFDLKTATSELRSRAGLDKCKTIRKEGAPIPLKPLKRWDNGNDVLVAGDAAGVVAPSSGEGIYYAMAAGQIAAETITESLVSNSPKALKLARQRFLKEHGTVFNVLGAMQNAYYKSGQIDLAVMLENVQRVGQMRIYSTDLKNDFGLKTAVEVSMTQIAGNTSKQVSFVIRETSRAEPPGPIRPAIASNDNNPSIAELVGSASLKEIVAETTDVIEKICIQTAVETTNNNKAAAAEMLGLSRQSLYVKLHKYGLVDTEEG